MSEPNRKPTRREKALAKTIIWACYLALSAYCIGSVLFVADRIRNGPAIPTTQMEGFLRIVLLPGWLIAFLGSLYWAIRGAIRAYQWTRWALKTPAADPVEWDDFDMLDHDR